MTFVSALLQFQQSCWGPRSLEARGNHDPTAFGHQVERQLQAAQLSCAELRPQGLATFRTTGGLAAVGLIVFRLGLIQQNPTFVSLI